MLRMVWMGLAQNLTVAVSQIQMALAYFNHHWVMRNYPFEYSDSVGLAVTACQV